MTWDVWWRLQLAGDESGCLALEDDVNVAALVGLDSVDDARNRVAREKPVEFGVRDFVCAQVAACTLEEADVVHPGGSVEIDHEPCCGFARHECLSGRPGAEVYVRHDVPFN